MAEMKNNPCPSQLGIDEHYFTRKQGYATTLCDLEHHRVYDVTLGRSRHALEGYFKGLKGRERVELVCMDMAETYRDFTVDYDRASEYLEASLAAYPPDVNYPGHIRP